MNEPDKVYTRECSTCSHYTEPDFYPLSIQGMKAHCHRFPPNPTFPIVNSNWICGEYYVSDYWHKRQYQDFLARLWDIHNE